MKNVVAVMLLTREPVIGELKSEFKDGRIRIQDPCLYRIQPVRDPGDGQVRAAIVVESYVPGQPFGRDNFVEFQPAAIACRLPVPNSDIVSTWCARTGRKYIVPATVLPPTI